ncbi:MAG: ABC transporter substrate-binding protein [Kiritimatiellae bacterium]|nr:ABC transporter substrate-binding protein [Kiritimatiellia bacterium]
MLPAAAALFCCWQAVLAADAPTVFRRTIERVASLDPAEAASAYAARSVALVYETLLEYDYVARPYRLIPGLAASLPEISADGLTYTVRISPEARFAPDLCFGRDEQGQPRGRPVTAADAVFALKRLADTKLASPGYWLLDGRVRGLDRFRAASRASSPTDYSIPVEGLQATDARTLRIELLQPCPPFLWMLAMTYTAVVPPEAVQAYGRAFGEHPVGSGPYRLAAWRRNYQMRFERDPHWRGWRQGPAAFTAGAGPRPFDRLLFPVMDDSSTQWLAFMAGELDMQGEIARDSWELVVTPEGTLRPELAERGLCLESMPTLEVAYIGINMDDPLLGANRALRQALNCAFDAPRWERYYQGRVLAADGPVPPGVAGRLDTPPPYGFDLDKARALLAEAGYAGGISPATGRRLRLTLDLGRTTQEVRESTELIVAFMERVGIELVPEYHNWPAFLRKVSQRQSQLFRIGWVGDYPDAENFLQLFYSPNASPGPNRCNFRAPAFDALYREALAAVDESERLRRYGDMQSIVRTECPWIFMHFTRAYTLRHQRVQGFRPHDFPYGMEKYLRCGE